MYGIHLEQTYQHTRRGCSPPHWSCSCQQRISPLNVVGPSEASRSLCCSYVLLVYRHHRLHYMEPSCSSYCLELYIDRGQDRSSNNKHDLYIVSVLHGCVGSFQSFNALLFLRGSEAAMVQATTEATSTQRSICILTPCWLTASTCTAILC